MTQKKSKCESPHVILDRSPRLRSGVDRLGLSSDETQWLGWQVKYLFTCRQGHRFSTTPTTLINPQAKGCPDCIAQRSLQALQEANRAQGVTCLATHWQGEKALYSFSCQCGHQWQRTGKNALRCPGCPACIKKVRYQKLRRADGLETIQQAAAKQGGRCLGEDYLGTGRPYPFICAQRHTWQAVGHEVLRGSWCKRCADQQKSKRLLDPEGFERLRVIAARHGGVCLDQGEYQGVRQYVRFRCKAGHEWETQGRRVIRGAWCPTCSIDKRRLTLADAQSAAIARGGQCLSETYKNSVAYMQWLCHRGHFWKAPFATIRAGHWCMQCAIIERIKNRNSRAMARYMAVSR